MREPPGRERVGREALVDQRERGLEARSRAGRGNRRRAGRRAPCPCRRWCGTTSRPDSIRSISVVADARRRGWRRPCAAMNSLRSKSSSSATCRGRADEDLLMHGLDRLHASRRDRNCRPARRASRAAAGPRPRRPPRRSSSTMRARLGVARHEKLADRVMARRRQVEAELGAFLARRSACGIWIRMPQPSPSFGSAPTAPRWSRLTRICRPFSRMSCDLRFFMSATKPTPQESCSLRGIVEALGARRQRVADPDRAVSSTLAVASACVVSGVLAFISPLPERSRRLVRPSIAKLSKALSRNRRRLHNAQSPKASRGGFFSIRLGRSYPTSRSASLSAADTSRPQPAKKWSARLSYFADHDRNGSSTQAVARSAIFCLSSVGLRSELPRAAQRGKRLSRVKLRMGASMNFASDNGAGVAPAILDAIVASSRVNAPAYGADEFTRARGSASPRFSKPRSPLSRRDGNRGERPRALRVSCKPWEAVFCHEESHVHDDECGAPEFFAGGAKLVGIAGDGGKITPRSCGETLARFPRGAREVSQPARSRSRRPPKPAPSIA